MTNSGSLFGIDPTQGFIDYVNTIKPYHTKLLDVLVEYVYTDVVATTVSERWNWQYTFKRPDTDTTYTCGYGYRWDATGVIAPEAYPIFNIKQAVTSSSGADSNSFLVEFSNQPLHQIIVTDQRANELAFAAQYQIVAISPQTKTFSVAGDITELDYFSYDNHVYITGNAAPAVNTRFTVLSATFNGTNTIIAVAEPISLIATVSGNVNVVLPFDDVPYWPSGTTVRVTSSGVLPIPLLDTAEYHFIPSDKVGFFTLANRRYPQQFDQFIDIVSLGVGAVEIQRTEPFVPGDPIEVTNAIGGFNNGYYIISDVVRENGNFRIRVLQTIKKTTPMGALYDGIVTLDQRSYDFPSYCPMTSASDLHTYAFIHEDLKFSFEISFNEKAATNMVENQLHSDEDYFIPNTTSTTAEVMPTGFDVPYFDTRSFDV